MPLIWPQNVNLYNLFPGKSKLNAVFTSQSKSKQIWFPWCLMPIGTIQHLNTQSTELTSVLVASAVHGEWRWQPQQNLLNSVCISCMSACVIECRSIGSCSSSWPCSPVPLHFGTKCRSHVPSVYRQNRRKRIRGPCHQLASLTLRVLCRIK